MQTQSVSGNRQADQAPALRDDRPVSTAFSSMLGTLFAAFPAGQSPEVAREAGNQDRPEAGRDVADAVRPGGTHGPRTRFSQEDAAIDRNPPIRQQVEPRSPDSQKGTTPSPAPRDASASQAGPEDVAGTGRSIAPSVPPASSSPQSTGPTIAPVLPADGNLVGSSASFIVVSPQGLETPPETGGEIAPSSGIPAIAGNAAATPVPTATPALPATPALTAGNTSVSAATPAAADSQSPAVTASGPQVGPAAPVLRSAQPAGPLAPSSVERVAAAVKAQASLGGGRIKILLHPPHLGPLRIEVAVRDGVVFARMETDSQSARHSLQQHSNDLRQSLEDQGLTLGRMSVSVSQGDGNGSEAPFASNPAAFFGDVEAETASDARPEPLIPRLLDVTV